MRGSAPGDMLIERGSRAKSASARRRLAEEVKECLTTGSEKHQREHSGRCRKDVAEVDNDDDDDNKVEEATSTKELRDSTACLRRCSWDFLKRGK